MTMYKLRGWLFQRLSIGTYSPRKCLTCPVAVIVVVDFFFIFGFCGVGTATRRLWMELFILSVYLLVVLVDCLGPLVPMAIPGGQNMI